MAFDYRGDPAWLIPHPFAGHGDGRTYGAAMIPGLTPGDRALRVIFSAPEGGPNLIDPAFAWEHVSVSAGTGVPTWTEMARVKRLFWGDDDRVVQFHPPKSEYINRHPNCLHLWRWTAGDFPHPPTFLVG